MQSSYIKYYNSGSALGGISGSFNAYFCGSFEISDGDYEACTKP